MHIKIKKNVIRSAMRKEVEACGIERKKEMLDELNWIKKKVRQCVVVKHNYFNCLSDDDGD